MLTTDKKYKVVLALLIFGFLFQAGYVLRSLPRELLAIQRTIGMPGLWRSANYYQSGKFADYVLFLNQYIPESARVVLAPVNSGQRIIGITPSMQFFLAPREVINCPDEDCLENLSAENTYIVFTDPELVDSLVESSAEVLMFNENWGVVVPENPPVTDRNSVKGFHNLKEILLASIWPLVWLSLLTIAGNVIARSLYPLGSWLTGLALGYGLALAIYSLSVASFSLAGYTLTKGILYGTTSLLILGALLLLGVERLSAKRKITVQDTDLSRLRGIDWWQVAIFGFGAIAGLISVGKAYHSSDAILLWGAKGYGIAASRTILSVTSWGTNTTAYPLHIPVLIASSKLLFTEILPASKIIFSAYYIGLMLVVYEALRQFRVKPNVSGLAALLVGTTPLVFRHATIAYANLALSFYLFSAIILLVKSLEVTDSRSSYLLALLSGLFFVGASWTRPEGMILSGTAIALIYLIAHLKQRGTFTLRRVVYQLVPLVLYGLFWSVLKGQVYDQKLAKADLAANALKGVLSGDIHLYEAIYILRATITQFFAIGTWGVLGFVILLALLVFLDVFRRYRLGSILILASGIAILTLILGIYYLASYDTVHDISWWVNTGLERMLIPGAILLWVGLVGGIELLHDHE